jgi:hypothetical protein
MDVLFCKKKNTTTSTCQCSPKARIELSRWINPTTGMDGSTHLVIGVSATTQGCGIHDNDTWKRGGRRKCDTKDTNTGERAKIGARK